MSDPIATVATPPVPASRLSQALGVVARVAVTVALLSFVLWRLDLTGLGELPARLSWGWLVATFGFISAAIAISAWKWQVLLSTRGERPRYARLFRLYMVGQFFNNLLPTSIGGDVVRAWEHSKDTGDVPLSAGSVVSERLIAGVVQGITSVLALVLIPFNPIVATLAVAFLVLDVAFAGLCVLPRFGEAIVRSVLGERFANTADVVSATIAEVRATLGDPSALLRVGVLSMAFQACVAGVNVCLLAALGHPVSLGASLVYTPMIFTLTPLPISISGFGVREASYWYFFGLAGVSKTDAIAASLLFFVAVALFSLPGAPLYFFGRRRGVRS